jgi:HEAT repeat protein
MYAAALWAVLAGGCSFPGAGGSLAVRLRSENPSDRIAAAIEASRSGDKSLAPLLVERLEDDAADVRFYAIQALERLTGQRLGYEPYAPAEQRLAAVQRWRRWLKTGQSGEQAMATDPTGQGRQVPRATVP